MIFKAGKMIFKAGKMIFKAGKMIFKAGKVLTFPAFYGSIGKKNIAYEGVAGAFHARLVNIPGPCGPGPPPYCKTHVICFPAVRECLGAYLPDISGVWKWSGFSFSLYGCDYPV